VVLKQFGFTKKKIKNENIKTVSNLILLSLLLSTFNVAMILFNSETKISNLEHPN